MKIKNIIYFIFFALINLNAGNQEERERVKEKLVQIINNINNLSEDEIRNILPKEYDFLVRAGRYNTAQQLYFIYEEQDKENDQVKELKEYFEKEYVFDEGPFNAFYFFKKCQGEECSKTNYTKLFIFNRREIDKNFANNNNSKFINDEDLNIQNKKEWKYVLYTFNGSFEMYDRKEEENSYNRRFNDLLSENK